jgi:hypothetical protein
MIAAARALAANAAVMEAAASDLADQVLREIERLDALRAALAAFIEPPEQVSTATPSTGSPAPAPIAPRVARDRGSFPADGEAVGARAAASPSPTGAAVRDAKLIAAGPYTCPGCGREFSRPQGVGRHRPHCTGRPSPGVDPLVRVEAAEAASNGSGKPDHPPRSHKYLCGRNCGRSFLSRQGCADHEAEAACQPKPTPPPTGREPFVINNPNRPRGLGQ